MRTRRWMIVLVSAVLALGLAAVPAFAGRASDGGGNDRLAARHAATQQVAQQQLAQRHSTQRHVNTRAAIITAADAYAKSGPAHIMMAADLYAAIQAGDTSYQIVDVRSAEHFALGHIDGAINIPFTTIADDASLAKLDSTKKLVVVCYTGETASMSTMVWSLLGYDARALLFGMSGWVADEAIVGLPFPSGQAAGYATTTTPTTSNRHYRAPRLSAKYASTAAAVKGQTKVYFAKGMSPIMTAEQVNQVVTTRDKRYQVISVRETADYATGHIAGAPNLVWSDIASQTRKLDPKKTIVVYCYTGNLGGEDTMLLNLLGYNTYNMMSGMSAWNSDTAVGGVVGFDPAKVVGYPVVK